MRKNIIRVLTGIAIIAAFMIQRNCAQTKIREAQNETKKYRFESDSTTVVNKEQSTKILEDNVTERQMREKIKELKLDLKNRKPREVIIVEVEVEPKEVPGEAIKVDSTIVLTGYYPQKDEYFARVIVEADVYTLENTFNFHFNPIDITTAISEGKDGIFRVDVKTPEYIRINEIEALSLPKQTTKEKKGDNFGLIVGAGIGKNFDLEKSYVRGSLGVRYKKVYLDLGANSSNMADLTLKFEF